MALFIILLGVASCVALTILWGLKWILYFYGMCILLLLVVAIIEWLRPGTFVAGPDRPDRYGFYKSFEKSERALSSDGESNGLINRRSRVRAPESPPNMKGKKR